MAQAGVKLRHRSQLHRACSANWVGLNSLCMLQKELADLTARGVSQTPVLTGMNPVTLAFLVVELRRVCYAGTYVGAMMGICQSDAGRFGGATMLMRWSHGDERRAGATMGYGRLCRPTVGDVMSCLQHATSACMCSWPYRHACAVLTAHTEPFACPLHALCMPFARAPVKPSVC